MGVYVQGVFIVGLSFSPLTVIYLPSGGDTVHVWSDSLNLKTFAILGCARSQMSREVDILARDSRPKKAPFCVFIELANF